MIFAGDDLGGVAADIAVMAEEFEKVAAADAADLARLEGLGCDFVGEVVEGGGEAEDVAGDGDFEDHGAAVAGGGGELDLSGADDKDALGALAFFKDDGAAGVGDLHGDFVEALDGFVGQIAEDAFGAVGALGTAIGNEALGGGVIFGIRHQDAASSGAMRRLERGKAMGKLPEGRAC